MQRNKLIVQMINLIFIFSILCALRPASFKNSIWEDEGELETLMWGYIQRNTKRWLDTGDRQYLDKANRVLQDLARVTGNNFKSFPECRAFVYPVRKEDIEKEAYYEWQRTGNDAETNWRNAEDKFKVSIWKFFVRGIDESA